MGFVALSAASSLGLALLAAIPLGAGRSGFMLLNQTLLMSNTKPAYYGRVASLAMMAFGAQALMAPIWGAMADSIGIRTTMIVVGVVAVSAMVLAAILWRRGARVPETVSAPVAASPSG